MNTAIAAILALAVAAPEPAPPGPTSITAPAETAPPAAAPGEAAPPASAPSPTAVAPAAAEPAAAPPAVVEPAATPPAAAQPPPTAAGPAAVASPPPTVAPAPAPVSEARLIAQRRDARADGLIVGGAVTASFGAATLVLVSLPALALYERSLEKADDARWVTQQERPIEQAQRRRRVMIGSAAVGASLLGLGAALLTGGILQRRRARRSAGTLSVAPVVGPQQLGMGASMRF
ncbi:MAG: hypothetical protein K0V04_33420 [Deltaproteobacteria bacterium]|nr:hypothetical protein [Deltaproteobacteria bacterium]